MSYAVRIALRWLAGLLVAFVLFVLWLYQRDQAPPGAPMIETFAADEDEYTARIVASTINVSLDAREGTLKTQGRGATSPQSDPGYDPDDYRRDVHAKSHGCVLAKFRVDPLPDPRFRQGVFREPKTFDAIIRYSGGKSDLEPDTTAFSWLIGDTRGMAIKLLNVPGEKLLDFEEKGTTQDFLTTNTTRFFIRTIAEYDELSAALGAGNVAGYFVPNKLDPRTWHMRELYLLLRTFKPRPDSLVSETYDSVSAYRMGPRDHVKYGLKPCASNKPMPPRDNSDAARFDYLRLELANQAAAGGACFDFMVQPQILDKNMPVEDTTVEWSESESPFVKLATVTLDKHPNNTAEMNRQCESLEFNPWHTLPDHKPVGVMNRIRKVVYQQMATYRRTKNCEPYCTRKCAAGENGHSCQGGCVEVCMNACPLLDDPPPLTPGLPASACAALLKEKMPSTGPVPAPRYATTAQ